MTKATLGAIVILRNGEMVKVINIEKSSFIVESLEDGPPDEKFFNMTEDGVLRIATVQDWCYPGAYFSTWEQIQSITS